MSRAMTSRYFKVSFFLCFLDGKNNGEKKESTCSLARARVKIALKDSKK